MTNPFHEPQTKILREAFPDIDACLIDEALWTAKGNIHTAFEILLAFNNQGTNNTLLPNFAKSPTVREELAQWRQELRRESKLKAEKSIHQKSRNGLPFGSPASNPFQYIPFENNRIGYQQGPPLQQEARNNSQRPLVQSFHDNSNCFNSACQEYHNTPRLSSTRSSTNHSSLAPALPPRRSNTTSNTNTSIYATVNRNSSINNLPTFSQSSSSLNSYLQERRPEHTSSNPFEEPDIPPPAYSEIQRDTVIHLNP
ncbi:hypothetical protein G6F46_005975 [Rhizopus delemar]|uniref:CUE domain-containing protein n=2 Tax=Rhizopus TaxID=4842 RepID=A0A9P7CPX0_9FUNG|nr:hypothetical protein G6F54_005285 [Rhizopus delemar]KAG1544450.1 hypothetical protein G6F51_006054 [Rhizopus arrhizus]KAG1523355.1 hypothetical protein G6F52_005092 [Rhizopus delemar]KAG1555398.1 hypothetical protein G6F49_007190 [Rhizopus delemar]KAG1570311.1 hypothetical protein G6F50_005603 [Rhizopus delemar]